MHSGLLKHPFMGESIVFTENHRKVIEIKTDSVSGAKWLKDYSLYRSFPWHYCLFADSVQDVEEYRFGKIDQKAPVRKKIQYVGYFATSLRDEIQCRRKKGL